MTQDKLTAEIYDQQLTALIECLGAKDIYKAVRGGLRPSAKIIQSSVVDMAKQRHPRAWRYYHEIGIKIWRRGSGYSVKLSQGDSNLRYKMSKKGPLVPDSHIHVLRFLSAGTAERKTKKGYSRGHILASHFFRDGVFNSIEPAAQRISADMMKAFVRAVKKAKAKYLPKNSGQPL